MADSKSATTIGGLMVTGTGSGVAIGAAVDNIPLCMAIGTGVGLIIGGVVHFLQRRKQDD